MARSELQHRTHGQAGAAGDVAAQGRSYCCPKPPDGMYTKWEPHSSQRERVKGKR